MNDKELLNIWKSNDQKLDELISINRVVIGKITKNNLNDAIRELRLPKKKILLFGIPYTLMLYFVCFIAFKSQALFVTSGFAVISILMTGIIISYFYHLYLINQIGTINEIVKVQSQIARLQMSSFRTVKLALLQIPFWSICWMSLDALVSSPYLYGGVNLLVFIALSFLAAKLYKGLNIEHPNSKISSFFLSGKEWEPILKASEILEQLKEYKD